MKYSIVIPCFNALEHTIRCIDSIRRHSKDYELILVDDCSTDGSTGYLKQQSLRHENTQTLLHSANAGFSETVNTGIAAAAGDFVVLLNSDTVVTPGWLDSLHSTFSAATKHFHLDKVGAVGPVSNYAGGEQGIPTDKYELSQLDAASVEHRATLRINFKSPAFCLVFIL